MLIDHFGWSDLLIVAGFFLIALAIGLSIRWIIMSKAALKNFFGAALIILFFVFFGLAAKLWPGLGYLNLLVGLIGLMIGIIKIKRDK